jgi:hypothetical protein
VAATAPFVELVEGPRPPPLPPWTSLWPVGAAHQGPGLEHLAGGSWRSPRQPGIWGSSPGDRGAHRTGQEHKSTLCCCSLSMLRLDLEERIGKSKGEEEEEIRLTRNRRRGSHVFRTLALTVVNAAHGRYETQHYGRPPPRVPLLHSLLVDPLGSVMSLER